jgi:hypothetical protein
MTRYPAGEGDQADRMVTRRDGLLPSRMEVFSSLVISIFLAAISPVLTSISSIIDDTLHMYAL